MAETDVTKILIALGRIEEKVDSITTISSDHETRIRALEGKSGRKWDMVAIAAVTALVSAIITLVVGYISKIL